MALQETYQSQSADDINTLPLHAITEKFGQNGLVDRFHHEISLFDPETQNLIEHAYEFSKKYHAEQKRMDGPHINHVLRVAIRIMHHFQVKDPAIIIAALLHDSVEDQAKLISGLEDETEAKTEAIHIITNEFGAEVAGLVEAVTNPEFDKEGDWHKVYQDHVTELLNSNPRAAIIKISDFIDNATGIIHTPDAKAYKLAPKYLPLVPIFKEAVTRPNLPLSRYIKQHIIIQLDKTARRLSKVIETAPQAV